MCLSVTKCLPNTDFSTCWGRSQCDFATQIGWEMWTKQQNYRFVVNVNLSTCYHLSQVLKPPHANSFPKLNLAIFQIQPFPSPLPLHPARQACPAQLSPIQTDWPECLSAIYGHNLEAVSLLSGGLKIIKKKRKQLLRGAPCSRIEFPVTLHTKGSSP